MIKTDNSSTLIKQ